MVNKILLSIFLSFAVISFYTGFLNADMLLRSADYTSGKLDLPFGINPLVSVFLMLITYGLALSLLIFFRGENKKSDEAVVSILHLDEENSSTNTTEVIEEAIRIEALKKEEEALKNINKEIQGAKTQEERSQKLLQSLCKHIGFSQGLLYTKFKNEDPIQFKIAAKYAFIGELSQIELVELGYGLNGQAAALGEPVYLQDVPKGYMKIVSGLGDATPDYLLIVPFKKEEQIDGFFEFSGFGSLNKEELNAIQSVIEKLFATK